MGDEAFAACEAMVRQHDPDRYFSSLFAPAGKRPLLFALYAFNHELARIAESVGEPLMGEIRLQWWRETIVGARDGKPRAHPVAEALAATFTRADLPAALFDAMIEARALDLSPVPFADDAARGTYLDATSANLMRLAAHVLYGASHDDLAHHAGLAYGLAGLLRSQRFHAARNKSFLHDADTAHTDARQHLAKARRLPVPKAALPAFLPASLVPLYLRHGEGEVPLYRKQLAMLTARFRGRL